MKSESATKMNKTAAKKQIACKLCKAVLKSKIYYQRHMKARHPKDPVNYTCDFDGKVFAAKNYLRIHMERHKEEILICNVCCRAYNSRVSFRRHLMSHLEKFVCSQCNASFAHKSLLNNHVASIHMDEMHFKCKFCTRMFTSKSARNNHHQTHKDKTELNFKCETCKIFFETKEDLRIHSFVHYNGEILTCHVCEQIFKNTRMLNIHMQKHSTSKFQCETCLQYFVFKSGLKKHVRLNRCKGPPINDKEEIEETLTDTKIQEIAKNQLKEISNINHKDKEEIEAEIMECNDDNDDQEEEEEETKVEEIKIQPIKRVGRAHLTYTCDKCGENVRFRKNLETHMREKHLKNTYSCLYCSAVFKSRRLYKEHSLEVHGMKERIACQKYECEICNRKFDIRSIFLTHKLSHEETRKYKCDLCDASFKSIGNLKRHQSIHRETRDYLCDICAKSFKTKPALKIHRSIHADYHIYINCPVPQCKTICKEKNLKTHMFNQHSEEGKVKKFECETCKKSFKNEFLLKRHTLAVHENINRGIVYKCHDCESTFNRQKDLRTHSFQHYSGNVFPCNECGKKFRSKRLLLNHSSVHAPAQFSCNLCESVFQTAGGRRKHIARHHKPTNIELVDNF